MKYLILVILLASCSFTYNKADVTMTHKHKWSFKTCRWSKLGMDRTYICGETCSICADYREYIERLEWSPQIPVLQN